MKYAGQTISAREWNKLQNDVSQTQRLTVSSPLQFTYNSTGPNISYTDTAIMARLITTDGLRQAWEEVYPDGEGGWITIEGGRSGSVAANSAYELNGSPASDNSVVKLYPGLNSEYVYSSGAKSSIIALLWAKVIGGSWTEYSFTQVLDDMTGEYLPGTIQSIAYSEQNIDIPVAPTDTFGPESPDVGSNNTSVGDVAWTDPSNIISSNNAYATSTLTPDQETQYLVATDFDFGTEVPSNALILGIKVEIEGKASVGAMKDCEVRLYLGGEPIGTNKSSSTALTGSDTTRVYDFTPGQWGVSGSGTLVTDSGFGACVRYLNDDTGSGTVSIDHIKITVFYAIIIVRDCVVRLRAGTDGEYYLMDYEPRWEVVRVDADSDPVEIEGVVYQPGFLMRYDQTTKTMEIAQNVLIRNLSVL